MLLIDRDKREASKLSTDKVSEPGRSTVFYDLMPTEKSKAEVVRLNQAGHELRPTDPAAAEELFRKALNLRKHDPTSWYNLGVCRYYASDLIEAVACYRHALRFEPEMKVAWNNLGSALFELGRAADAEEAFDSGIRIDPSYPKFFLGKANLAAVRGDFEQARDHLRRALEIDPQYQPARIALRRLYAEE